MKKLLIVALAVLALGAFAASDAHAATYPTNRIVKGSSSTLYWYSSNGRLYTFPNMKTFYSWFPSSELKKTVRVSNTFLNNTPRIGNVTYRPGYKLVRFVDGSTVYAVSRYGILRPIANPTVATDLYGYAWGGLVETIPTSLRKDYSIGSTITDASQFNVSAQYHGVKTPTDNVPPVYPTTAPITYYYPPTTYVAPIVPSTNNAYPYGTLTLTSLSRTNYVNNDVITYVATLSNTNVGTSGLTIRVYNQTRSELLSTCSGTYTCNATKSYAGSGITNESWYAVATLPNGTTIQSASVNVNANSNSVLAPYSYYNIYGYSNANTALTGTASIYATRLNDTSVTITANITNASISTAYLSMSIYESSTNYLVQTCSNVTTCQGTAVIPTNGTSYYVVIRDNYNHELRATSNVVYPYYNSYTPSYPSYPVYTYPIYPVTPVYPGYPSYPSTPTYPSYPTANGGSISYTWMNSSSGYGRSIEITATIANPFASKENTNVQIYDANNPSSPIGTCNGTFSCAMEYNLQNGSNTSIYAVFSDNYGGTRQMTNYQQVILN